MLPLNGSGIRTILLDKNKRLVESVAIAIVLDTGMLARTLLPRVTDVPDMIRPFMIVTGDEPEATVSKALPPILSSKLGGEPTIVTSRIHEKYRGNDDEITKNRWQTVQCSDC